MKSIRVVGVVAAIVTAVVAVPAISSTTTRPLVLLNKGQLVKDGTHLGAYVAILFPEYEPSYEKGCIVPSGGGTMVTNALSKDTATFTSAESQEPGCELFSKLRGGQLKEIEVTGEGKLVAVASPKWKVEIEPGPCVYEIAKLEGTFAPNGEQFIARGTNETAIRNNALSATSCARTAAVRFIAEVWAHAPGSQEREELEAETP